MIFAAPEWLFLLPALLVFAWHAPRWRLHEPCRALALLTLVLALADPRVRTLGAGLDLWVLVDRSDSCATATAAQEPEIESILARAKHHDDQIYYIDFAVDACRRDLGDPELPGGNDQTRTATALEYALAQMPTDRAARLLVLTDGYATEPLGETAEKVLRRGVPLDYRLLGEGDAVDFRVGALETPPRVLPGEAFLVEFTVVGNADADVPWEVTRDGKVAATGTVAVRGGTARVRLTDRLGGSGAAHYMARIRPVQDAHPENNTADAWVEITGGPRALLVTDYPDDPLAALLGAQGLAVDTVTAPDTLTPAALAGVRLVVLNNVPSHRVAPPFLAALDFFVREQGGGLLMAGGQNSFGSGGYFGSPVDPLLPVSMELRKDRRKLATAMAIVMDRSGSMAASAGNGQTKMDLADSGAARAIELLGELDAVSVHAIDTAPHEIVPLAAVGPNRAAMTDAVRRVQSSGGGIVVPVGLQAGWDELKKAQTGTRHLLLFADANDSRQQVEGYDKIAAAIAKDGITITVIGLGTEHASDADILQNVAAIGGGKVYFDADPNDLPAIFAEETVSIARSAFIRDPTPAQGTPGWAEVAARTPAWPAAVDGYNLSYLKPEATQSLVSTDDYNAPLVATWARGAGRAAAVSFPLGGPYSDRVRAWPGYGDFLQTLTRWLAGDSTPPGLALRTAIDGQQLTVELLYDESWATRVAQSGPEAVLAVSTGGRGADTVRPLAWEKIEPGRFRATADLTPGRVVRGVARLGGTTLPFGPAEATGSVEWSFDRDRLQELRQLSQRSGGRERLDLAEIWDAPRPPHYRAWRDGLLIAWVVLLLADAALTRLGISLLRARRAPAKA
jgi:uncharacterized membrane protein